MTVLFQPLTTPYAPPPAAPITARQCAALMNALEPADLCAGGPGEGREPSARTLDVTPLPLARLARLVDYDLSLISVLEEAQFLGRLVALTGSYDDGDLMLELAEVPLRSAPGRRTG